MKINHQSDYIIKRINAYPSVEDQLDMIFHKGVDEWQNHIRSIKEKYPKPTQEQSK